MKILFALILFLVTKNLYSQKTAKEIYDENTSKVEYIEIYDSHKKAIASGSGFLIDSDGLVITIIM